METQTERLVQSNEGTGDTATAEAVPEQAQPPVDESLPPELRPDKDGNPPKITEELLRRLRGKYFTVRHPFLKDCEHKLDMINEPRHRHCENCWWTWFNSHGPLVETADQMYRTLGPQAVEALRGKTFVKMFRRFMATVYHFKQELEKNNESAVEETVASEVGVQSTVLPSEQEAATTSPEESLSA